MATRLIPTEVSEKLPLGDYVFGLQWPVDREAVSASTLPADLRDPATGNLEDATGRLVIGVTTEVSNNGRDVLFLDSFHGTASPNKL